MSELDTIRGFYLDKRVKLPGEGYQRGVVTAVEQGTGKSGGPVWVLTVRVNNGRVYSGLHIIDVLLE